MPYIEQTLKELAPEETVRRAQNILSSLGIECEEKWYASGIENCWSMNLSARGAFPLLSNGKGITRELARASAYGEFMERLQTGLFLYKFQSIGRDPGMDLQSFAPDGKYMTMRELVENGEWMDYLIETYGGGLTRQKLAKQCKAYACADEDRILTLPFYSLFEKKTVYLPAAFVEQMYSANGCCAGNSRNEAWVHALSEIMERSCSIAMVTGKKAAPRIPEEVLNRFPTVAKILKTIRENGNYDVQIFDASGDSGFPVVSARMIDRKNHRYIINFSADPVLEIALSRTLTEVLQGRNLDHFNASHNGRLLEEMPDLPMSHNVLNQVEVGEGLFSLDYFTDELTCDKACTDFADRSGMNNRELLACMLRMYRDMGRPVYVRNYSFLGFCSYQIVVPGFSESRGLRLTEPVLEYALGDDVAGTLRNAAAAERDALLMLLMFHKKIDMAISRRTNFGKLAGLPIDNANSHALLFITLSYAAYRLGRYGDAARYTEKVTWNTGVKETLPAYYACVLRYLQLKLKNFPAAQIRSLLGKFYETAYVEKLYGLLDQGKTPYDADLVCCDTTGCATCRHNDICTYAPAKAILQRAGQIYSRYTDGQNPAEFAVDLGE